MAGRRLPGRKALEHRAVDDEDVEPAVAVEVEHGDAAAGRLEQVLVGLGAAVDGDRRQPGRLCAVFGEREAERARPAGRRCARRRRRTRLRDQQRATTTQRRAPQPIGSGVIDGRRPAASGSGASRRASAKWVCASARAPVRRKRERELIVRLGIVGGEADGLAELRDGARGVARLHLLHADADRERRGLRVGGLRFEPLGFGQLRRGRLPCRRAGSAPGRGCDALRPTAAAYLIASLELRRPRRRARPAASAPCRSCRARRRSPACARGPRETAAAPRPAGRSATARRRA